MSQAEKLVVSVNGGPRLGWNTDLLLKEVERGAREEGAETRRFDLYRLDFKGCASCFSCKRKESSLDGVCALKDDLSEVLAALAKATGVVMGSPIYIGDVTGAMRSFWERYAFAHLRYDLDEPSVLERGPGLALVYASGMPEAAYPSAGYDVMFREHLRFFGRFKAPFVERLFCSDTLQFSDHSKYHAPMFDPEAKRRGREERFPGDLAKAREIGRRLGRLEDPPRRLKDL